MTHDKDDILIESAMRVFRRRIFPMLFIGYFLNCLDRSNVSFAQLKMGADLGLSLAAYGLGAGLFFIGYAASCVPSNLLLKKIGVRRWLGILILGWGLVSCLMATTQGEHSFYLLRILLGATEAGFIPAVNYYMTTWVPPSHRSRVNALLITALPMAMLIGGPISGALLELNGYLRGWQWLFVLEGLPTVILSWFIFRYLPETPRDAVWLDENQRNALTNAMGGQTAVAVTESYAAGFSVFVKKPVVWGLLAVLLIAYAGTFALIYFLPVILKSLYGVTPLQIGWLLAIPNLVAIGISYIVGRTSERTGDIRLHLTVICIAGGVGFLMLKPAALISLWAFLAVISLITSFTIAYYGPLNAAIQNLIGARPGPLALVTTIGATGGFIGPSLTGFVMQLSGGDWRPAALAFAIVTLVGAVLAFLCVRNPRPDPIEPALKQSLVHTR